MNSEISQVYSTAERIYCHLEEFGISIILNYTMHTPLKTTGGTMYFIECEPENLDKTMLECIKNIPDTCKEFVYMDDYASETDITKIKFPETLENLIIGVGYDEIEDAIKYYKNDKINVTYTVICDNCQEFMLTNQKCFHCK